MRYPFATTLGAARSLEISSAMRCPFASTQGWPAGYDTTERRRYLDFVAQTCLAPALTLTPKRCKKLIIKRQVI